MLKKKLVAPIISIKDPFRHSWTGYLPGMLGVSMVSSLEIPLEVTSTVHPR